MGAEIWGPTGQPLQARGSHRSGPGATAPLTADLLTSAYRVFFPTCLLR